MRRCPPVAIAAALAVGGGLLTLAIARGPLTATEFEHLAVMLPAAIALTIAATALVAPRLARASMRVRFVSIAAFATLVGLANLAALAFLMVVSGHHAVQIAVLLVYATAAGVGAALATARASTEAVERLSAAARSMADGDLSSRVGPLDSGRELDALAATLDEMAERLDTSLRRERAAEAQRRDLVTAVSHDLRTPLSGLRAMAEAIDDGIVEDPDTVRRYVGEMRGAIESLVTLVDDLFELVQLDAGAIEAESERARVGDVVRSAVAACDAQATEKGLVLETSLGAAAATRCSPRLTRVVQNLLQNAIRHTPGDGTVRVEARRNAHALELVVEDSGEGIDRAAAERVFEPFWRGDVARASTGSGLGLALAKRIVEALGGSINLESEPAQGSRFAVVLPNPGK
jgi:signal transduction histidine kinase